MEGDPPPARGPRIGLTPLALETVLNELNELYVDHAVATLYYPDQQLYNALDRLVKGVKGELELPGVWRNLEVLDRGSVPLCTFQWFIYHQVTHLRRELAEGHATSVEVNIVSNQIHSKIANGCLAAGEQAEGERQERQLATTPLPPQTWVQRPGAASTHPSIGYPYFTSALEELQSAAPRRAHFEALHEAVHAAVATIRNAVPSFAVWEDLAVRKFGTEPPMSYQQLVLRRLESISVRLRDGRLRSLSELETEERNVLNEISEAKQKSREARTAASRAHPRSQVMHSMAHGDATAPITWHRAARYGTTPEALARRWA